jgi:hypothetical protein
MIPGSGPQDSPERKTIPLLLSENLEEPDRSTKDDT